MLGPNVKGVHLVTMEYLYHPKTVAENVTAMATLIRI